jgi:hypothetical protein
MEPDHKPSREHQRQLNDATREVVKKEVMKLLHAGIIYPVQDSEWVSPVQVVPKKGDMIVVQNEKDELIPQRNVTGCLTRLPGKISPSLMRCLNGWPSIPSSATSMDILVIIKFLFIRMTRIRLPSPTRTTRSPTGECHLVYATHPLLFRGA